MVERKVHAQSHYHCICRTCWIFSVCSHQFDSQQASDRREKPRFMVADSTHILSSLLKNFPAPMLSMILWCLRHIAKYMRKQQLSTCLWSGLADGFDNISVRSPSGGVIISCQVWSCALKGHLIQQRYSSSKGCIAKRDYTKWTADQENRRHCDGWRCHPTSKFIEYVVSCGIERSLIWI